MILRCIIIDDEYLARQRLSKLLESFKNIVVVAECRNGNEALEKIPLKEPDLIFLDIQMPDMDGFTVLSKLAQTPSVIFTTAYDSYALKAFEINAVDYLLKPFDEDRLQIAIDRIVVFKKRKVASNLEGKVKNLLRAYEANASKFLTEISLRIKGRPVSIFVEDVLYFKSDGNYVQLITDNKTYLYRSTLNTLFTELDPNQFIRIHRAIVLNKIYIKQCSYLSNNEYKFFLKNEEMLLSSRSYSGDIAKYLDELE